MLPTLNRVEIVREENRPDLPPSITVRPYYNDVDRPDGIGVGLLDKPAHWALARRLKAAIEAGVAYPITGLGVDNAGKTYVRTHFNVIGRTLNADLKRLGF